MATFGSFSKFFTPTRVLILAVGLLLVYIFFQYAEQKSWSPQDGLVNYGNAINYEGVHSGAASNPASVLGAASSSSAPTSLDGGASASSILSSPSGGLQSTSSQSLTDPSQLLPSNNNAWGSMTPGGNGLGSDMLTSSFDVLKPISTKDMKNPNLTIRPDPEIPIQDTGIWNQSTISRTAFQYSLCGDGGVPQ
jgi:hypothetical protein